MLYIPNLDTISGVDCIKSMIDGLHYINIYNRNIITFGRKVFRLHYGTM